VEATQRDTNMRVFGVVMGRRRPFGNDPEIAANLNHQLARRFAEINALAELRRNNHLPHPFITRTLPFTRVLAMSRASPLSSKAARSAFLVRIALSGATYRPWMRHCPLTTFLEYVTLTAHRWWKNFLSFALRIAPLRLRVIRAWCMTALNADDQAATLTT
jgi:hypothetical protein